MPARASSRMASGMPSRWAMARAFDWPGRPMCRRYVGDSVSDVELDGGVRDAGRRVRERLQFAVVRRGDREAADRRAGAR